MQEIRLPPYLFRGTTINYPGNKNAQEVPFTYTTKHPVKALWFALECYQMYPSQSVIYLANAKNLFGIPNDSDNWLSEIEEEIMFTIKPVDFYPLCEGYIHVVDFQAILKYFGLKSSDIVGKHNLTRICDETPSVSLETITMIVEKLVRHLKNE